MKVIVTGGAGFIGSNAVKRYLSLGHEVVVIDNLARPGSHKNLEWLNSLGRFTFLPLDIRDGQSLSEAFHTHRDANVVLHLAGQVAVTTSVESPRHDFEVNALGTFNLLEAVRANTPTAAVIYSSTNKVYGELEHVGTKEINGRYGFADRPKGISEAEPLDFHSPYGCSKGSADQYVRDYARIYGLRTVSLRQSCIYGYRQFGVEDQGWLAWFTIATVLGKPLTIYGDGKQVRDVLFVDDLCDLYLRVAEKIETAKGQVFNIGGGVSNQLSLLELVAHLERLSGKKLAPKFADWRPGDQPAFVCDLSKAARELGWEPKVDVQQGIEKLYRWVVENQKLF